MQIFFCSFNLQSQSHSKAFMFIPPLFVFHSNFFYFILFAYMIAFVAQQTAIYQTTVVILWYNSHNLQN